MAIVKNFNDFLEEILAEHNLAHGYEGPLSLGIYTNIKIFERDSMTKNSFLKRLTHPLTLLWQRYSVHGVANLRPESAIIEILDSRYTNQLEQIMKHVRDYRKEKDAPDNLFLPLEKRPIELTVM